MGRASGDDGASLWRGQEDLLLAFGGLEKAIVAGCEAEAEWPAQIAGGVCAGVDFAVANPLIVQSLTIDAAVKADCMDRYEHVIGRLAGFIRIKSPPGRRLPASTDEALVAGLVELVGEYIRIGRLDHLAELRPELVLMVLLPYLGFAEAQRWANRVANLRSSGS